MFKTVLTLFRGSVAAAGEELEGRIALLILDQQMRDAAAAVERAKRTLALAIAAGPAGGPTARRHQRPHRRSRNSAPPRRSMAAGKISHGKRPQAIANLEAERDAAMTARTLVRRRNRAAQAPGRRRRSADHRTRSRPPHRPRLGSGSRHAPRRRRGGAAVRIDAAGSGEHAEAPARAADRGPGRRRSPDRNRCRQRTAGDRRKARRTGLWTTPEINRG